MTGDASESELAARVVELEIRSEERRADIERLQEYVAAYEGRITRLEQTVKRLTDEASNLAEAPPPASEDLPPHY